MRDIQPGLLTGVNLTEAVGFLSEEAGRPVRFSSGTSPEPISGSKTIRFFLAD